MKKILSSVFLVLVAFTFAACSDDDENAVAYDGVDFRVSATEMTYSKTGGTATLSVLSKSAAPAVTVSDSWLSVAQTSVTSNAVYAFGVTAEANTDTADRTATITVSAGSNTATVSVTQTANDGLVLTSTSVSLSAAAQEFTVTAAVNGDPEITISDSWITQVTSRASMTTETYTFSVSTNYTEERVATITFTVEDLTETFTVTQASGETTSDMSSDAKAIAANIYAGVNIGNTMEATGSETAWGNPVVNSTYIAGLKALGFNAVRIPCAWDSHLSDESTYEIDPDWLNRVNEVVGYCVDNDMYVILNIHWDGGWLEDNISGGYDAGIDAKQEALWTQIATKFNSYDEHLLFAGCNEPGMSEGVSDASAAVAAIMAYEQTFVDAVRATGGNNAQRCLVVQATSTNIDYAVGGVYGMPTDTADDRLLVEVHFYDPYQFCLMEEDATWSNVFWYWGEDNHVSGSEHNATWGEEDYVTEQMQKMKSYYVDNGIPVILGEYAPMIRTVSENQTAHENSRAYWNEVVTREAKNAGMAPFYWETGDDINRSTGAARNQYAIDGIMAGAKDGAYPY